MQGATAKAVTGTPTKASPAVSKAKAAAVKASSSSPAKASPKKAKSTKRTPTKKKAGSARARDADEASSEPNAEPGTAEHGEEELEEEDSEDLEEEELSNEQIDKAVRLKLAEDEANKPSAALSCDMISATHHVSSSAAVSPEEVCARLTHVRLDRLRLASCPEPVLSTLHSVTHLYLQHNRLESIEAIGCLTTLKFLTVASNRLRQVSGLQSLPALLFLDVSRNSIESLPHSSLPHSLKFLQMADNPCCGNPATRAQLLAGLPQLLQLDGSVLLEERNAAREAFGLPPLPTDAFPQSDSDDYETEEEEDDEDDDENDYDGQNDAGEELAEGEEVGAAVPSSSQRRGTRSWMFDGARTLDDVLDRLDDMERVSEARSAAQALAQQHVLAATAHAQRGAAAGAASSSSSRPGSAAAFCASGGIATALDAAAASHRAFESRVADDLAGLQAALQSLLDPSSPRNYNEVFSVTDKARELIRSHMQRSKAAAAERTRLLTAQAQELERNIAALSAAGPGAVREARRSAARRLRDRRTSEFDELRASMAKLRSSVDASIARLTADFENGPGASAAAADDLRRLTIREDEDDDDENEDDDKDAYGGEDDGLGASNDDDDGDGLDSVSAGEEDDEGSSSLGGEDEEPGEEGEPRAGARRGSRLDTRVARDAARSSNSSGSRLATAGSAVAHRPERAAMKAFKSSSLPPNPFA